MMSSAKFNAAARAALAEILRTQSDFMGFVLDHFPEVHRRFTDGMDRTAYTNLLLEIVGAEAVLSELKIAFPAQLAALEARFQITITVKLSGSQPPPAKPAVSSGEPSMRKPHGGLLLGLIALLTALGIVLSRRPPEILTKAILQMIDVGLALLAMIVCYTLGPTFGVFKNRWGRVSGSAAVFIIVLLVLIGFVHQDEWTLSGEILNLPNGKVSQVRIGKCPPALVPSAGQFVLGVNEICAREPYEVVISVEDCKDQRTVVVSLREYLRLEWRKCEPDVKYLDGHVYQKISGRRGSALEGVKVELVGCDEASQANPSVTDESGFFNLFPIYGSCQQASYHLRYHYAKFSITDDIDPPSPKAHSIDILIELPKSGQISSSDESRRTIPSARHSISTSLESNATKVNGSKSHDSGFLVIYPFQNQPVTVEKDGHAWKPNVFVPALGKAIERLEYTLTPGSYNVSCRELQGKPYDWKRITLQSGKNPPVWCQ